MKASKARKAIIKRKNDDIKYHVDLICKAVIQYGGKIFISRYDEVNVITDLQKYSHFTGEGYISIREYFFTDDVIHKLKSLGYSVLVENKYWKTTRKHWWGTEFINTPYIQYTVCV